MVIQLFVNFDKASYRPGELITGNVTVNTSSQIEATGLTLSFQGNAWVHWTEQETRRNSLSHSNHGYHSDTRNHLHPNIIAPVHFNQQPQIHQYGDANHYQPHHQSSFVTREYRNNETYFNSIVGLPLGSNLEIFSTGNAIILQAGYFQQIPFTFQLPTHIPSSCKLAHGGVTYFAEACLRIKRSLLVFSTETSKTVKQDFHIIGSLDLALENDVLSPLHERCQTTFRKSCCCCCFCCFRTSGEDGEFQMDLRLTKRGFISGEPIVFSLAFSNATDSTVKEVNAYLDQNIHFVTFGKEKVCTTRLGTAAYNASILPGTSSCWSNQLRVPNNAYLTDLGGCRIIHVKYTLTVKAKASIFRKAVIQVPITIGTVYQAPPPPAGFIH